MPFVPFVLLIAWQAVSKSASFALGWATALFFGQIPGNKGRLFSIMALISVAWVIVGVGALIPLAVGIVAQEARIIGRAVEIELWHLGALAIGLLIAPPAMVAVAETGGFDDEASWGRWLGRIPLSYPIAASLGVSVLLMVVITPFEIVRRKRRKHTILHVPLIVRDGRSEEVTSDLEDVLRGKGLDPTRSELTGPLSWPFRTIRFAAQQLLGSVIRGDPVRIRAAEVEVALNATNVSLAGPAKAAYPVRAAIMKELAFSPVFLTWSDTSQELEAKLKRLRDSAGDLEELVDKLDRFQEEVDAAELRSDEWNLLYRLRLQMERDARRRRKGRPTADARRHSRVPVAVGR